TPAFVTVVSLDYTDGWSDSYFVPLSLLSDDKAQRALVEMPNAVLARITGARKGAVVDGLYDDDTCDRLLAAIAAEDEIATPRGSVHGVRTMDVPLEPERKWTRTGGDQSNSLAFVNDRFALKLFRRIEPAVNPEYEISRFLTDQ